MESFENADNGEVSSNIEQLLYFYYMQNNGLTIRHKLYDFIRVSDDKKLAALYHLLEDDILQTQAWWEDKAFIKELDKRFDALEKGTDKGIKIDGLTSAIDKLKTKKYG